MAENKKKNLLFCESASVKQETINWPRVNFIFTF